MDSTLMQSDENVVLNGKQVSKEQLNEQKQQLETQKGVKIVEVQPGQFRTRIQE